MAKAAQARLPEMAEGHIEELHGVAEEYVKIRDRRMGLTEKEVQAKANVIAAMKKHNRTVYRYDDIDISLLPVGEKLKVRKIKDESDEAEEA